MSVLLNVVVPVLLLAALAFVAQPRLRLDARTLSRATFYLFSPALVLSSLLRADLASTEFSRIPLAVVLITLALWFLAFLLARGLRLDGSAQSAFLLATLFVNAGNYGLPVILFAFGERGLAIATLYFATSSLIQSSLGVYLAARGSAQVGTAIRVMLQVPVLYAAVVAVVLNVTAIQLPELLARSIGLLGQASIPVMLTLMGVQLANLVQSPAALLQAQKGRLAITAGFRLVAGPLIGMAVALLLGLPPMSRDVVIVESAMPTAVYTIILATEYRADPEFVTSAVLISTLTSMITVTGILTILV